MKVKNFADRLLDAIDKKRNPSIIGLDSDFSRIPDSLRQHFKGKSKDPFQSAGNCILQFNKKIIDSIHDIVPAVKMQSAFYEQYGPAGCTAFLETVRYAKSKGLIVIGDVKRGDIGNTSKAYSNAYLGKVRLFDSEEPAYDLDGVTVNPYLGLDGISPFIEDCRNLGKGIFVLVKTSNPSSKDLQDIVSGDMRIFEKVARHVDRWGINIVGDKKYSSVGAVVGATYPTEAETLRKIMPGAIFLVPGYGAQGGGAADIVPCFNPDGYGAIVHSARAVIFAYEKMKTLKEDFGKAARDAALLMKYEILSELKKANKSPWK
jgi:orotidine-5'-phosphate decarboxylase